MGGHGAPGPARSRLQADHPGLTNPGHNEEGGLRPRGAPDPGRQNGRQ